jgi:uncharacterized repeat protein (TIGR02543 family)
LFFFIYVLRYIKIIRKLEDLLKNRVFITGFIFILLVTGIVISGCTSPTGGSFALEAPGCTATWNVNTTWVAWSYVEDADYYVIYGKRYDTDKESPPRNPKIFDEIYRTPDNKESYYSHNTKRDFSYAVKAFKKNGDSSDFSNVAFTW